MPDPILQDAPDDIEALARTVRELTGERRLVSSHNAAATLKGIIAHHKLTSQPWVAHVNGRSWLMETSGPGVTDAGVRYLSSTGPVEELFGLPTDHPDGSCWECSGVEPPPGASLEDRKARDAEEAPTSSGLRWQGKAASWQ